MKKYVASLLIIASLMMGGCGDDSKSTGDPVTEKGTITIGGVASFADPLPNGASVEIQLVAADGTESLRISNEGVFSFEDKLQKNENYAVAISDSPVGKICSIANATGQATGVNIININVSCN